MWIPVTLAAASFQILRTARQHRLRSLLSVNGAGFVRYAYGFPLALVVAVIAYGLLGAEIPRPPTRFWLIIAGAGLAQILATVALLRAFDLRDFAIGTVYSKTEVILVALVSAIALGESLRPAGWSAAIVCTIGVAWLAAPGRISEAIRGAADPAAFMGILAGLGFALAAGGIRAASTSIDASTPDWSRTLVTLTAMLGIQSLVNGGQLAIADRAQLGRVVTSWRAALPVGLLSLAGSACWAFALTLTNAAKVRTLGQVELVFAFVISAIWLGQRHRPSEYAAAALVLVGVVGVITLG